MNALDSSCNKSSAFRVRIDTLVLFAIVVTSSNPYIYWILGKEQQLVLPVIIALIWGVRRHIKFTRSDIIVFSLFLLVMLAHVLEFGTAVIASSVAMVLKLIVALLIMRAIPNFFVNYVFVMYVLSIVSLFFYLSPLVGLDFKILLSPIGIYDEFGGVHVAFHNYKKQFGEDLYRNMGFFGEPGIFAGFLVLALLFIAKDTAKIARRHFYVLIVALLSTQSTTGYLVGLIVVPLVYMSRNGAVFENIKILNTVVKMLFVFIFLIGFFSVFNKLPFLSEKLDRQSQLIESQEVGWQLTRIGNAQFDMGYIADRPFFGWSQLLETRKLENEDFAFRQGNGLTGFAVRYGLVGMVIYFLFAYGALKNYYNNKSFSIIAILAIALLLNGEHFLNYSLFLSLMFLPATTTRRTNNYSMLVKPGPSIIRSGHLS